MKRALDAAPARCVAVCTWPDRPRGEQASERAVEVTNAA